ncbi:MAG: nucleotidyltransferase substrate binding protein [Treponema sp.]|nr:nucleotidyltransferase substrate binding protein [Treponema sp.]
MKDYLEEQRITGIIGSKNAIRHAFNKGIIEDGEAWMKMQKDRNLASHLYDEEEIENILIEIKNTYYCQMNKLADKMNNME